MKIALVTTTINVPKVLDAYRKLSPDSQFGVGIFVAGDHKTAAGALDFVAALNTGAVWYVRDLKYADENPIWKFNTANAHYYSFEDQVALGYKHSEMIGWNTDSRRNIAVLEALKWGADVLISIDDDMIPLDPTFFDQIVHILGKPFSGVCLGRGDSTSWLDAGSLTIPPARQRGLPPNAGPPDTHEFVHDVQIGAMQGIILGVPDTDAATTIANRPLVHSASDILKAGFVVDPSTKAVFNSQITTFRRELAPAFAQFYKWESRNTDILASVIMRRVMRERNLYTYYGPPTGFHARAPRDPLKDLNAEMFGLNAIRLMQEWLDGYVYMSDDKTPLDMVRRIYTGMSENILPKENIEAALAWCDDCESVL